jgi:hypothetical protein
METKRLSILDTKLMNSMFGQQELFYAPYNAPHQQKGHVFARTKCWHHFSLLEKL